jgi:hypothetical protein
MEQRAEQEQRARDGAASIDMRAEGREQRAEDSRAEDDRAVSL